MKKTNKKNKIVKFSLIMLEISKKEFLEKINIEKITFKKNISIHGFRKGKVPSDMIYRIYKRKIIQNSLEYLMKKKFFDYVNKKEIKILENPKYIFKGYSLKKTIDFSIEFYEYLSSSIKSISNFKVIKPKINITDSDKSFYLKKICRNYFSWKQNFYNPIKISDKITIDYRIKLNQLYIKHYEKKNFSFIIGDNLISSKINKTLIGHKIGDVCIINKKFSSNYFDKKLQGKKIKIIILIKNVEQPYLSLLRKKIFLKKIKHNLFQSIKKKIKTESNILKNTFIKNQMINHILKKNSICFPKKLIQNEINLIYKYYNHKYQQNFRFILSAYSEEKIKNYAIKNLILKLNFKKIINDNLISVNSNLVQNFFQTYLKKEFTALNYIKNYYKKKKFKEKVDNYIIEQQIYLSLLKKSKIIKKNYSFQQLVNKIKN